MPLIVFDPGHGGWDTGAIGPSGLKEKDVTLPVCMRFRGIFKGAANIRLTRIKDHALADDEISDCYVRARVANECRAAAFISIHCNGSVDPQAHGMEVWTSRGKTGADKLAACILNELKKEFPNIDAREDWSDGDCDKEANFIVLRETYMPAVLVELPFITNPAEEMMLKSADFQKRTAEAIARGAAAYLDVTLPEPWDPVKEIARLKQAGLIESNHTPKETVDWGEFATVINRLKGGWLE